MKKDFVKWHNEKTEIHNDKIRPFFHEREVWFSSLGENVGFEQDGRGEKFLRPLLILRKFNNEVAWIVPLTRTQKSGKYYFHFSLIDSVGKTKEESVAILSQIRLVDAKRLDYKIGDIPEDEFRKLKEALVALLK